MNAGLNIAIGEQPAQQALIAAARNVALNSVAAWASYKIGDAGFQGKMTPNEQDLVHTGIGALFGMATHLDKPLEGAITGGLNAFAAARASKIMFGNREEIKAQAEEELRQQGRPVTDKNLKIAINDLLHQKTAISLLLSASTTAAITRDPGLTSTGISVAMNVTENNCVPSMMKSLDDTKDQEDIKTQQKRKGELEDEEEQKIVPKTHKTRQRTHEQPERTESHCISLPVSDDFYLEAVYGQSPQDTFQKGYEKIRGRSWARELDHSQRSRSYSPPKLRDTVYQEVTEYVGKSYSRLHETQERFVESGYDVTQLNAGEACAVVSAYGFKTLGLIGKTADILTFGTFSKFNEGKEWVAENAGTNIRRAARFLTRDQRLSQNLGDYTYLSLSLIGPKYLSKTLQVSSSKLSTFQDVLPRDLNRGQASQKLNLKLSPTTLNYDLSTYPTSYEVALKLPNIFSDGKHSAKNIILSSKLQNQLTAKEIASGHALEKHVVSQGEFAGYIRTRKQLEQHIENVLNDKVTQVLTIGGGRTAFIHRPSSTVLIRNPTAKDGGTVFQPFVDMDSFLIQRGWK